MTTATSLKRWHTAYHEASHCAIATVLGVRVLQARVNLSGGGSVDYVSDFDNAADLRTRITVLSAGWCAEQKVTPGHKNLFGWSTDYSQIEDVVHAKLGDSSPVWERHTVRIYVCYSRVLVHKYWDRIQRLAKHLFEFDKIDDVKIREIMDGAPKPSSEDHQRALEMVDAIDRGKK